MANTLDQTFDALANEYRRDVVRRLRHGPLDTPALAEFFPMSRQALHRHVRVLEDAGLVRRRRRGRTQCLELAPEPLANVSSWIDDVRRAWESSADRLGDLLDSDLSDGAAS